MAKAAGKSAAKAAVKGAAKRAAQLNTKPATKVKPAAKTPAPIVSTGYWLLKSEPDVFSWEVQKARGAKGEPWTGVRNYLARNYMRAMRIGDLAFFYHSNIGKEIVGVVRVSGLAHPDADDDTGTWECVDVIAVADMPKPVSLAEVKANSKLETMALVTSMRLSVQPVSAEHWAEVCRMGGLDVKSVGGEGVT
jgi:predicted RNA-binding protein with PUA-like domain